MQFQLEQSQWWTADQLLAQQFRQLHALLMHAWESIPFYRERLKVARFNPRIAVTPETFSQIPLLSRSDVQKGGAALLCRQLPHGHGEIHEGTTSGSTGRPLKYLGTQHSQLIWQALTLRDHLWHKRDFKGKLGAVRVGAKDGSLNSWGPPANLVFETGPAAVLKIGTAIDIQVAWLQEQEPDYLLSYPSNVLGLAKYCLKKGIKLQKLREVRTLGEALNPELRIACQEAWGVPVVDIYSANEIGYIALQCPEHDHYHVQSESVLVEILREDGTPCQPGEIGKMTVSSLHNYAMPLIRYELGDYAEAGEPCSCGRGLPVIKRIMGRQRNLITLPNGKQRWPIISEREWMDIAPIEQIQLVQKSPHQVEARLVMPRRLSADEQKRITPILQESLGYAFQIDFSYHGELHRSASGKYEDFISEIEQGPSKQHENIQKH